MSLTKAAENLDLDEIKARTQISEPELTDDEKHLIWWNSYKLGWDIGKKITAERLSLDTELEAYKKFTTDKGFIDGLEDYIAHMRGEIY